MNNFTCHIPTRFIFGKGTESEVGKELLNFGGKILFHYGGGSIKKSGLYNRIIPSLKDSGIEYIELGGVKPNPRLSLVREGIDLCRTKGVKGILAVGGGSVIDSAKAIGIGVPYNGDVWDFYTGKAHPSETIPVGTMLTIPATGSEGSVGSVITDLETKSKFYCNSEIMRPVFSILNPEITFTLPPFQTACGISDIISHILERYFTTTRAVDFTDRLCEATLKTVINAAPRVLRNPENYDTRAEIMWAGTIAHNDLLGLGREEDWASHQIEHELSAQYDVAHGAGLAVIYPAWMKYVRNENLSRFIQFAVRVWDVDYTAGEKDYIALEGIRRHKEFFKSIGLPTSLETLGIKDNRFALMAKKAMRDGPFGCIKKMKTDDVIAVYNLAREG